MARTWTLQPGVKDLLALALEHRIEDEVAKWKEQVANGEIDAGVRSVFVALGWITPHDNRVIIDRQSAPRSRRGPQPEPTADAPGAEPD